MAKQLFVYIGPSVKGTMLIKNKTYIKEDDKFLIILEDFLEKYPSFSALFISITEFAKAKDNIKNGKSIYNHKITKALEEYKEESEN